MGREVSLTAHREHVEGARRLDLSDQADVEAVVRAVRPDIVLVAAAEAFVERCELEPELTRRVNVEGPRVAIRTAAEFGAKVVVFSSEYVFNGAEGRYSEKDPVSPLNEYGRQKVELEEIARSTRHLICRTSGLFGADPRRRNFVLQLIDSLRAGREFTVPSDQLITPTYARDLARAVVELLDRDVTGTLHAAGPDVLERFDFAHRVATAVGLDASLLRARPTSELGLVAARPRRAGLSDGALRGALGRPLVDTATALARIALDEREARSV